MTDPVNPSIPQPALLFSLLTSFCALGQPGSFVCNNSRRHFSQWQCASITTISSPDCAKPSCTLGSFAWHSVRRISFAGRHKVVQPPPFRHPRTQVQAVQAVQAESNRRIYTLHSRMTSISPRCSGLPRCSRAGTRQRRRARRALTRLGPGQINVSVGCCANRDWTDHLKWVHQ